MFWERELDPKKRNRLLSVIFENVAASDGVLVAVTPREPFLAYFQFAAGGREGSDGTRTRDLRRDR